MFHAPTSTLERSPTPNPQNWNRGETPPEPTGRTVSARLINNLLMAAEQQGCDGNALLQRSGIAPIDVLRGDARIATSSYARLQRHAMRAMEDESLGCMPGRQHLGTWAMVCRSVIQCSRLGHALGRMFKHYALFEWSLHCHIETDGDECIIHVAPREGASFQYELRAYEMVFSVTHAFACWLVQTYVPLHSVNFSHARPEYADDYRFLFQCEHIQFDQPKACLRLPRRMLDMELRQDEQSLEAFLANGCMELDEAIMPRHSWSQKLRKLLDKDLQTMPEFDEVARMVNLHPQTLRRRLANEGTTFKDLKDDVRRASAVYLIQRSSLSIEEVAYRSGFSEASAFIRAFRRWTGQTPMDFRQSQGRMGMN